MADALAPRRGRGRAAAAGQRRGKPYRGIKTVMLWATAQAEGYPGAVWATYRQWAELGAQIRKGEQSSPVVFWKINGPDEGGGTGVGSGGGEGGGAAGEGGVDGRRPRVFARCYSVFNAAQVEGYAAPALPKLPEPERIGYAEAFFAALGADIRHGGNRACYVPSLNQVRMLPFPAFRDAVAYYVTLAHEATHWTGHASRCARDLRGRFGEEAYAAEELVAELGAAFICADLALTPEPRPDHAAYVASWLRVLRGDKRAILRQRPRRRPRRTGCTCASPPRWNGPGGGGAGPGGIGRGWAGAAHAAQPPPDRLEAEPSRFGRRTTPKPVCMLACVYRFACG